VIIIHIWGWKLMRLGNMIQGFRTE
jgi:hypothetical protein